MCVLRLGRLLVDCLRMTGLSGWGGLELNCLKNHLTLHWGHAGHLHKLTIHLLGNFELLTWLYVCTYVLLNLFCVRELFNAAFVSCWMELTPIQKEDLVVHFKQALLVPNIPEITQTLLNLAEFMEHCEEATVSHCVWDSMTHCVGREHCH